MFQRAQFLRFAGDAQIRHLDLVGVAFPGDLFAERVELVLVGDARHVHEALFEGRRGFLENRVDSPGSWHTDITAQAFMRGS